MIRTGSHADFGVILNQDLPEQEIPELLRQSTFLSAKENPAFIRLFESTEILKDFLNAVLRLDEDKAITEVEHINRDLAVIYPSDDIVSVDVHARTKDGEYFDIEMQKYGHTHFKDRVILYGALMAAEAHREEVLSLNKRRRELSPAERYRMPKIYSIWICDKASDGSKEYRDTWGIYRKSDIGNKDALPVSDVLNYIFIKLPKLADAKDVPQKEREWMDFIANSGSRSEIPNSAQGSIRDAYERLRIRRTPREILERQAFTMTTQYDIDCCIDDAINDGLQKGLEQGLKQGLKQGLEQGLQQGKAQGLAQGLEQGKAQGLAQGLEQGRKEALIQSIQVMRSLGIPEDKIAEAERQLNALSK